MSAKSPRFAWIGLGLLLAFLLCISMAQIRSFRALIRPFYFHAQRDLEGGVLEALDIVGFVPRGDWRRVSNSPVVSPSQDWEDHVVYEPTVLYEDGRFRMWYTGGCVTAGIGYASSQDGIHWEKYSGNPLVGKGRNGIRSASQNNLVRYNGIYYLFFVNGGGEGAKLWVATSTDGIDFHIASEPVLTPSGWARGIANSFIFVKDGRWHLIFESIVQDGTWRIGTAEGSSPYHFDAADGGPMQALSIGGMYGGPWLQQRGGTFRLFYHAARVKNLPTDIYSATSSDLIHWVPDSKPILKHRYFGWEFDQVADPSVVDVGSKEFLFYDGDDNREPNDIHAAIGVAVRNADR